MLSETDSNGVLTEYEYLKGTNLLRAKFISYYGRVRTRELYEYNHGILIQKIVDDGADKEIYSLREVTERHFTELTPQKEAPVGLPEKVVESYLENGQIERLKKTKNTYSLVGKLIKQEIYDRKGNLAYTLEWKYDDHGNLLTEKNAKGEEITKKYDDNDNLIKQEGPISGHYVENSYDFANRLITQREVLPDNREFVTSYTYDYLGQCVEMTNPYGHVTKQTFDEFGRVTEIISPTLFDENGKRVEPVIKKEYDIAGNVITLIDAKEQKTTFEYNIRGQPTRVRYLDGTSEQMIYRLDGKLVEKVERSGTRTVYKRDPIGRILEETQLKDQTELRKTTHEYNSFHLTKTIDAEGSITEYTYDNAGRLKTIVQGDRCQENSYDTMGRISEIKEFYGMVLKIIG